MEGGQIAVVGERKDVANTQRITTFANRRSSHVEHTHDGRSVEVRRVGADALAEGGGSGSKFVPKGVARRARRGGRGVEKASARARGWARPGGAITARLHASCADSLHPQ